MVLRHQGFPLTDKRSDSKQSRNLLGVQGAAGRTIACGAESPEGYAHIQTQPVKRRYPIDRLAISSNIGIDSTHFHKKSPSNCRKCEERLPWDGVFLVLCAALWSFPGSWGKEKERGSISGFDVDATGTIRWLTGASDVSSAGVCPGLSCGLETFKTMLTKPPS